MKLSRYSLVIFCFFSTVLLSCWGSCGDVLPHFRPVGIETVGFAFDRQDRLELLENNSYAKWEDFIFRLGLESEYYSSKKIDAGSLMALSCLENGHMGSDFGVLDLSVVTLTDYNEEFSAGDTINPIINVSEEPFWNSRPDGEFVLISDYITQNFEGIRQESLSLRLIQEPSLDSLEASFVLLYYMRTKELFSDTISVNLIR